MIPTETLFERRTDLERERARRRAPPMLVTLALAAVPPAAIYALTRPTLAVAALAVLTVLVVARGRPRTE